MPLALNTVYYVPYAEVLKLPGIDINWCEEQGDSGYITCKIIEHVNTYEYKCSTPKGKTVILSRAALTKHSKQ